MNPPADSSVIDLDSDLDLVAAAALKERLLEAVDGDAAVVIDASSVERLTTPCAQVLVAAVHALAGQDKSLILKTPSEAFVSAFADLGLEAVLQQRMESP